MCGFCTKRALRLNRLLRRVDASGPDLHLPIVEQVDPGARVRCGSYANLRAAISLFLLRDGPNGGKEARRGTRRVHLR
jgi:hypothetical protein